MADNPIAVVTGGESGIGAACVAALAKAGARVVFTYFRDADAAAKVTEAAGADRVHAIQCDVSSEDAVEALFADTERRFGTATWLVNSAGLNMSGTKLVDMPLDHFDRVIRSDQRPRRPLDAGTAVDASVVAEAIRRYRDHPAGRRAAARLPARRRKGRAGRADRQHIVDPRTRAETGRRGL